MKNYEKYADEIRKYKGNSFCSGFIKPNVLKTEDCGGMACGKCYMLQTIWLLEDYEEPKEPEVDWNKVEVDTPILVKYDKATPWVSRHFAKYENGLVYAWKDGCTSWSILHDSEVTSWKYAKLAGSEEE